MRKQITLYDDQYKFYKTFNSKNLLIAFVEFMFEDIEPTNLNDTEKVLFDSLRLRMDNQKKKSFAGSKSRGGGRPKKQQKNNTETTEKQQKNNTETTKKQEDKDNITNVILFKDKEEDKDKEKENNKEKDMCNKLHGEWSFDLFWSKYPSKKDKKKAMQKFNKMNEEKRRLAIEGIDKLKESDSWKRGFIPMPTTYLNGERREDEVETKKSSYNIEQMKERERQMRMEQAREILTPKQSTNGNASETKTVDRRANISGL